MLLKQNLDGDNMVRDFVILPELPVLLLHIIEVGTFLPSRAGSLNFSITWTKLSWTFNRYISLFLLIEHWIYRLIFSYDNFILFNVQNTIKENFYLEKKVLSLNWTRKNRHLGKRQENIFRFSSGKFCVFQRI